MHAKQGVAVAATVTAIAAPMLVVHWFPAGHGLFAQVLAVLLWGLALAGWAALPGRAPVPWRALKPLLFVLGGVAFGVALSTLMHRPPAGVWLGSLGVLATAAVAAMVGAKVAREHADWTTRALIWGLSLAAFVSLGLAALQLAAPKVTGFWIAPATTAGRASANLEQPNHLATLLLWAWLAVAAWSARALPVTPPGRSARAGTPEATARPAMVPFATPGTGSFLLAFALQAGVVATASRAGLLASMAIGLWAALDRRLPRPTAWLLWITALSGVAMTVGRALMTPVASLGAGASLVRPGARGGIFVDTLVLIRDAPLTGVGWMEFQFAWTLSPLGDRGPRYFAHASNLVMQLIVELGLPLGLAITAALLWGAFALLRSLRRVPPAHLPRALMLAGMLGVVGLHSLFDAPFWQAYLLLPSAWAWGCLVGLIVGVSPEVGTPSVALQAARARGRAGLALAGVGLAGAAFFAWLDFRSVSPEQPLTATAATTSTAAAATTKAEEPAAPARTSRLFGYYADRRRALSALDASPDLFRSARWVWVDTQLLVAWVAALERSGRVDEARYLTQRAREFRDPDFSPWLAACRVVAPMEPPSRCRPPGRAPNWREFR